MKTSVLQIWSYKIKIISLRTKFSKQTQWWSSSIRKLHIFLKISSSSRREQLFFICNITNSGHSMSQHHFPSRTNFVYLFIQLVNEASNTKENVFASIWNQNKRNSRCFHGLYYFYNLNLTIYASLIYAIRKQIFSKA